MPIPQVYPDATPIADLPERIWQRVNKNGPLWNGTPCWVTNYTDNGHGYIGILLEGKRYALHRLVYARVIGAIPDGLDIDHLCENRGCCNPAHLEPVTEAENATRTWARHKERVQAAKSQVIDSIMTRDLFTVAEAAGQLGLSPKTLRQQIRKGKVAYERVNARLNLISAREIERYRQEHLGTRKKQGG